MKHLQIALKFLIRKTESSKQGANTHWPDSESNGKVSELLKLPREDQLSRLQSQLNLPIIHFHVLPIEEKHSRGNITDVKILRVNRSVVHIYQVNSRHLTEVSGSL